MIHVARYKIEYLEEIEQSSYPSDKPMGFWYAPGKIWINWVRENLPDRYKHAYYYIVKPDYTTLDKPNKNKVLQIRDERDFDNFTFIYGQIISYDEYAYLWINWNKVGQNFGGIEIVPFLEGRYHQIRRASIPGLPKGIYDQYKINDLDLGRVVINWYDTWDIASGCIWNPKAIKHLHLINKNHQLIPIK